MQRPMKKKIRLKTPRQRRAEQRQRKRGRPMLIPGPTPHLLSGRAACRLRRNLKALREFAVKEMIV